MCFCWRECWRRAATRRGPFSAACWRCKPPVRPPPELILLDIAMPEMNGYEVCEQLKADETLKEIPVIFISALSETMDKVKAFHVGGVDYVTKPFHFEEVYARVQTHLNMRLLEKLRDDLTQMVIHDLRNPLTAIFGVLEMLELKEGKTLSDDTQKFVRRACQSVKDMIAMISSILDVSKMNAGAMKLQREPCDINALSGSVVDAAKPFPGNRTVRLEANGVLPTITIDGGLIRRVIQNLLGNALKYTPERGGVRMAVTSSASEVRVAVTDTGSGIAPEDQHRIFEKFGQVVDRQKRVGTGLGLTFCKLVVEAHGGHIGVESEIDKGSTFWFTLPRVDSKNPL